MSTPTVSLSDSILNSTKKLLGIDADYTAFDTDVTMHINSALATLGQLGVGPAEGYAIEDDTQTWADFLGDMNTPRFSSVKTYVYMSVRVIFDPPAAWHAMNAMQQQITELGWRINVNRETGTSNTIICSPDVTSVLFDGGRP